MVVNCKTYASASGHAASALVDALATVNSDGVRLVLAVSAFDLHALATAHPHLEFWAQHLDPVGQGSFTGWLEPETAMDRGASGTLINTPSTKWTSTTSSACWVNSTDASKPVRAQRTRGKRRLWQGWHPQ